MLRTFLSEQFRFLQRYQGSGPNEILSRISDFPDLRDKEGRAESNFNHKVFIELLVLDAATG